ncbi:MAG: TonB-dependent receptor [Phocaeicola sp.]|nr:TonB-dependent receptor [Phocaeicola sp.]
MKLSYLWVTIFSLIVSLSLQAQVKGKVTNAQGEPLIGATLIWVGTGSGTVTQPDGSFRLDKNKQSQLLAVSYVGHLSDTLHVDKQPAELDIVLREEAAIDEVVVKAGRPGVMRLKGATHSLVMSQTELMRAACCNLGESFTSNPSVDVSYSDAATGAKQIKLLGLSGAYVQMLAENIPSYRGVAAPYSLGFVPGTWLESIHISKGSASVKNGYESITGQINIEYKKPQADEQALDFNTYIDSESRAEANFEGNIHLNKELSTAVLAHYENTWGDHDDNKDGFMDKPKVEQFHLMNRWAWVKEHNIFQAGIKGLKEDRNSGQSKHHTGMSTLPYFGIGINTERYDFFAKNAVIFDHEKGSNIALMVSGSYHNQDATYGNKVYDVIHKSAYASLLYETKLGEAHELSTGLSWNIDHYNEHFRLSHDTALPLSHQRTVERTPGAYVQYTYTPNTRWTLMGGIRVDHSNLHGTFVTPRMHIKYAPWEHFFLRASVGKGYRTVFALGEYNYLMASGRNWVIDPLEQESAWNYGITADIHFPVAGRPFRINAEYFYTHFLQQAVVDMDSTPNEVRIGNLDGRSFSHTFQVEVSYPVIENLTLSAAYRYNDVKTTYGGKLMERPLTGKYKGLITAGYKTPLGIWQFDATLQLNGGGRMPTPYTDANGQPSWEARFKGYEQLNVQVTRWFRNWSLYVGAENLTGFKQKKTVIGAENPWGQNFDPTLVWGPVHGAMIYAGFRLNLTK